MTLRAGDFFLDGFNPAPERKNLLINGNFKVWQRGTSYNTTGGYTCADRWYMRAQSSVGGTVSGLKGSDSRGGYLKMTFSGSTNTWYLRQPLEDSRALDAGGTYTLQFKTGNDVATTMAVTILCAPNDGVASNTTFYNAPVSVESGVQETEITFTVPSSYDFGTTPETTGLVYVIINLSYGDAAIPDGSYRIWDIQLEKGEKATSFENVSSGETLALCQRYYYAPVGTHDLDGTCVIPTDGSSTRAVTFAFPTTMRDLPTLTATYIGWSGGGTPSVVSIDRSFVRFYGQANATGTHAYIRGLTAEAEL